MTDDRRNLLRSIMKTAWDFARSEPGRPFGDCLRGAWKIIRAFRKPSRLTQALSRAAKSGTCVRFSPMLYRSPTANRARSRWHGYKAAYLTAQIGR